MSFNGSEGTFITLSEGSTQTQKYRTDYLSGKAERKAIFFGKDKLEDLLAQTGCEGLRFYFGAEEVSGSGESWTELTLVVVGADSNENDQLGSNDKILDVGVPCPTNCPSTNSLNS